MKSDIQLAFENSKSENRPALLTYTVAADPNIKNRLKILNSIAKHADLIELDFPTRLQLEMAGRFKQAQIEQ